MIVAAFAVIPFSPYVGLPGTALATGIIYLVAMSSLDVCGIIMAGWGSNNKYALMGGLRSAAQMISIRIAACASSGGRGHVNERALTNNGQALGRSRFVILCNFRFLKSIQRPVGIAPWDFSFKGFTPWCWFFLINH